MNPMQVRELRRRYLVSDPDMRIWWAQIIRDINGAGLGQEQIAEIIGISRWMVYLYRTDGNEPKFTNGSRLLELWSSATSRPISEAPMCSRFDYRYTDEVSEKT